MIHRERIWPLLTFPAMTAIARQACEKTLNCRGIDDGMPFQGKKVGHPNPLNVDVRFRRSLTVASDRYPKRVKARCDSKPRR